jgi:hypothetical protein
VKPNGKHGAVAEAPLESVAGKLGGDAFDQAKAEADLLVAWEKKRLETRNLSEIAALNARGSQLVERRDELKEIVRHAPPDEAAHLYRQRFYYWTVAFLLFAASVFFAHLSLAPFGLGWEAWVLALGFGIVTAVWTDRVLQTLESKAWIKAACIGALILSVTGILILAHVRGEILALYLASAVSGADTTGTASSPTLATAFYHRTIPELQMLMGFLAVSMELGSGMCLFEARKFDFASHKRAAEAREELKAVDEQLVATVRQLIYLENEPAIQEADFYRKFYLGMLERIKQNMLIPMVLILALVFSTIHSPIAHAQEMNAAARGTNVVIAIDLTESVAGASYDGKTDYEKNIDGACRLIGQLPAGSHLAVIAITDQSFSQPYMLLQSQLPPDKGPLLFVDRVAMARNMLASKLRGQLQSVKPRFRETDLFGALVVAASILGPLPGRKVLVIFSDMRQATGDLNLERPGSIAVAPSLRRAQTLKLVANLEGVEVYALGVDAEGRSVGYWNSLRDFWTAYFNQARASVRAYSMLRDIPQLAEPH